MLTPETTETLRTIAEGIVLLTTMVLGHKEIRRRRHAMPSVTTPPERRLDIRREEWNRHTDEVSELTKTVRLLVKNTDQDRWRLEQLIAEREALTVSMAQVAADVVAIRVQLARMEGAHP